MNTSAKTWLRQVPGVSWLFQLPTRRWLRRHLAYVRSCKIRIDSNAVVYKATFLAFDSDAVTSETRIQSQLENLLANKDWILEPVKEVQWMKGRFVTAATLELECESVQRMLAQRQDDQKVAMVCEKIAI